MSFLDDLFTNTTEGGDPLAISDVVLTGSATIAPGSIHLVHGADAVTVLTLVTMPVSEASGQRIAVKVIESAPTAPGGDLIVAVPVGMFIEDDNGVLGQSAMVGGQQIIGNYREWKCDGDGVWRMLAAKLGGDGTSLPIDGTVISADQVVAPGRIYLVNSGLADVLLTIDDAVANDLIGFKLVGGSGDANSTIVAAGGAYSIEQVDDSHTPQPTAALRFEGTSAIFQLDGNGSTWRLIYYTRGTGSGAVALPRDLASAIGTEDGFTRVDGAANVGDLLAGNNTGEAGWLPVGAPTQVLTVGPTGELAWVNRDHNHGATHQDGGADEISIAGLSGKLADPQTPTAHAASHAPGSADAIATVSPPLVAVPFTAGPQTITPGHIYVASNGTGVAVVLSTLTLQAGLVPQDIHGQRIGIQAIGGDYTGPISGASFKLNAADLARIQDPRALTGPPVTQVLLMYVGYAEWVFDKNGNSGTGLWRVLTWADNQPPMARGLCDPSSGEALAMTPTGSGAVLRRHTYDSTIVSGPLIITEAGDLSSAGRYNGVVPCGVSSATPAALVPGGVGAAGSAPDAAKSGHSHSLPAFGSAAATFCEGNDARLSNARIPTAHKASHQFGGADVLSVASLSGKLADPQVADQLKTTSGVITVAAAAPTAGQVLVATASDQATWQTLTAALVNPAVNGFRLAGNNTDTPATGTCPTLYWVPVNGDLVGLYYAGAWNLYRSAGASYTLSGRTAGTPFDVFAYWDTTGTPQVKLEVLNWTSGTARAVDVNRTNGVWTKVGDQTRRYVGTVRPRTTTSFSLYNSQRYDAGPVCVDYWNVDNRQPLAVNLVSPVAGWSYTTGVFRQAGGNANAQIEVIQGLPTRDPISLTLVVEVEMSDPNQHYISCAIGMSSTTVPNAWSLRANVARINTMGFQQSMSALTVGSDVLGYNRYVWLEKGDVGIKFRGNDDTETQTGMSGTVWF